MKRSVRIIAALMVGSAVMAACGSSSPTSSSSSGSGTTSSSTKFPPIPAGPITLGVSTPLSGAQAAYGITTQLSFNNVTLKAFNAKYPNGIDGHPVKLDILDDASDVTKAVNAANQLVSDHVAAVLTVSYNPEAAGQQYAILNKNKIPVVSVLSGSQYTDTKAWPYDFGTGPSVPQEGKAAGAWIQKHGYKKIATIDDGLPQDTDALHAITGNLPSGASVVKAVTVSPGSVDMSSAVAQLKGSNPDLLVVYLGYGYGPLWSAIRAAGWSPPLLVAAGAWYDGFTAMGPLAQNAVAPYNDCASSVSETFAPDTQALMEQYSVPTADVAVNYLTFVQTDTIPLEIMKYAIEKYHSLDPNAIKQAIEGIHGMSWYGITYDYSSTNHYGLTGPYAAAVCNMAPPYAGGKARVPVKAS